MGPEHPVSAVRAARLTTARASLSCLQFSLSQCRVAIHITTRTYVLIRVLMSVSPAGNWTCAATGMRQTVRRTRGDGTLPVRLRRGTAFLGKNKSQDPASAPSKWADMRRGRLQQTDTPPRTDRHHLEQTLQAVPQCLGPGRGHVPYYVTGQPHNTTNNNPCGCVSVLVQDVCTVLGSTCRD